MGFIEMKGLGFWSKLSLRGVSEFEDWVSNPTPKFKGGFTEARVGFPIQPNLKGGFLNEGLVVQSNPRF
jgi:hypothetical protein